MAIGTKGRIELRDPDIHPGNIRIAATYAVGYPVGHTLYQLARNRHLLTDYLEESGIVDSIVDMVRQHCRADIVAHTKVYAVVVAR